MRILEPPPIPLLQGLEPFSGITPEELEKISSLMQRQLFAPGEVLIEEGAVATKFFVMIEGKLEVVKSIEGDDNEVLNVIDKSGELFGEMALVEDKVRSAGIIARDESEVLVVQKEGFLELVNHFPQFTLEVARSISHYLRKTDSTLIGTLEVKNRELNSIIEELNTTREALVENERLSIVGRMASTILHDLKNPMTTIAGFAQLIGLKEMAHEDVVKYTKIIAQQVNQFNTLAQELLAFANGSSTLQLQEMKFPVCIEDSLTSLHHNLVQQSMNLETDFQGEALIQIDPSRFYRVYENLANNAIEAMSAGGTLTITSKVSDDHLIMTISDTGHGMEAEVLSKVFDEFFTHKKHGGTGLGLAIVKSIITDHNGEISVESVLDQGTTFTITLPILKP
ncbi:MAG: cyclic nucleotide-binding domain-containing protein [FCB group bacterium]|nr:cyclic nucleotide-binding domain-containing protein [FCB group bacterium]MBL7028645.1 cyclic nucleotide-binding domain-containing protein [Candidatus Neomarinimicrobiota bacterium]MBL7121781.1 cyclic nucleotide-binding domain-containing protein [Candidatus Neomarinimicrobiota bacterium]